MQDYEEIKCPYCRAVWGREKTSGVYITAKLTPEQQQEWSRRPKKKT